MDTHGQGFVRQPIHGSSHASRDAFLGTKTTQLEHLIEALADSDATVLLVGELGYGKAFLAQSAAQGFTTSHPKSVADFVITEFSDFTRELPETVLNQPRTAAALIIDRLEASVENRSLLLVVLNIDSYSSAQSEVLEQIVRTRRARILATAHQVTGAADRLARHPKTRHFAAEPFSLSEAGVFLSRLLGVDRVATETKRRWHQWTRGNQHALGVLALAAERRGAVQRARRVAWVSPLDDIAPADFVTQLGGLSDSELSTLELVSFAAPLGEPALLQLLDGDAVNTLITQGTLTVATEYDGSSALTTQLPVLADAVRAHLSPLKRMQLAAQCFDALNREHSTHTVTTTNSNKLRLVRFGIEGGREVEADWAWQAMRATSRSGDLHFALRLTTISMAHPDARCAAEAVFRAIDLAHFLGERETLLIALSRLHEIFADEDQLRSLDFEMQVALTAASICYDPTLTGRPDLALAAFDHWEQRWAARGQNAARVVQACRMRVLALNGQLRSALEAGIRIEGNHSFEAEILSAPAHTFEALLRVQRGEFQRALSIAQTTRQVILLDDISPSISGDLEGLAIFLCHWARGTTHGASHVLANITVQSRDDLSAVQAQAGLIDLMSGLFALQEARWSDAAASSSRLLTMLAHNDPFGVAPLAETVSALALAALGESDAASDALQRSAAKMPGVSEALSGFAQILALRARHWLRDPDLAQHALHVAKWAEGEDLPLIELQALDVYAHEQAAIPASLLNHAARLASEIDQPIGGAILAHIYAMTNQAITSIKPEERLLSELGLWLPLPPAQDLTGREREIAIYTALGYSSKHIAERLHISARTIETHLTHVYGKLGVGGREELREWFSRRREGI